MAAVRDITELTALHLAGRAECGWGEETIYLYLARSEGEVKWCSACAGDQC